MGVRGAVMGWWVRRAWLESGVPVSGGWAETSDVWMHANHLLSRCVTRRVRVEATVDLITAMEQDLEPARIRA